MQDRFSLNSSARYVKGIGPKVYKLLNKLDIYTVEDLLYYFPLRHEDRSQFTCINKIKPGNVETIKGKVIATNLRRSRRRMAIFQAAVEDKTGVIYAIWFNQAYLKNTIKKNTELVLHGKIESSYRPLQITSPEYEIVQDEANSIHMGRIVPIYKLTKGLNQKRLRKIMYNIIKSVNKVEEFLPEDVLKRNKLINIYKALGQIHFPNNKNEYFKAKERLIFDEFFMLQILVAFKRMRILKKNKGISHKVKRDFFLKLQDLLNFQLTNSQKKVINQIVSDMCSSHPMNRLLQGDVGCGKTVVSMFASLLSLSNGYQVAFMVPTEILALQHYRKFKSLFSKLNFSVGLLISSLNPASNKKARDNIENGKVDLIIGTHSLIQEKVNFSKLGLVIIDEQHRFGVLQRAELRKKGSYPDVLLMTATPIPRTLTIALYGDMDISIIDSLPPGRKLADTYWISEDKKSQAHNFIKRQLEKGRQCYVVCPLVEDSSKADLKAATFIYEKFRKDIFKDFKVGLLHGRMKPEKRDKVLDGFLKNKIKILVTTLVIEVGVDIPNASVLMVENAERFGLSQLHQLRGRISRAGFKPYCILVSDTQTLDAEQRLETLVNTVDGFKIAEVDLKLRGPGEFVGTKQHGITEFKIAHLLRDIHILEKARREAFDIIKKHPFLKNKCYDKLKKRINSKYKKSDLKLIGA